MNLELITRQEQIIAGKDLEPITRTERFLKEYGVSNYFGETETVVNEPLNITWDGNTEGLVSVAGVFYKISDLVLTDEQISLVTVHGSDGSSYGATNHTEAMGDMVFVGFRVKVVVIKKDNAELEGIIFPEKGLYFMLEGEMYVTSLTTTEPVPQTKTVVHKLDKKFLPAGVVWSVNGTAPDENGNVEIQTGSSTGSTIPTGSATGTDAVAIMSNATASASYTFAVGYNAQATSAQAFAIGLRAKANGVQTFAIGMSTTASDYSMALGHSTEATGNTSYALGNYVTAASDGQMVLGKYGVTDSDGKYTFIIGNGSSASTRANAMTIDSSHNVVFFGTIEGKALILPSSTEGSTKKFKLTVDDSGIITATEV